MMSERMDLIFNDHQKSLRPDCANCFALCCVALPFAASADFAFDKRGGVPCGNLQSDFRCGIHGELLDKGFKGCTVFECFGAGQKVSQITFGGRSWKQSKVTAQQMFDVFPKVQQLQEMLVYLTEALSREETIPLHPAIRRQLQETEKLTLLNAEGILDLSVPEIREQVNPLLVKASEMVRAVLPPRKKKTQVLRKPLGRGTDLIGARLGGKDLRGMNFRSAFLIASDLKDADLRKADFIGADLRDADLRGADLNGALFLTQMQLNAAHGNAATAVPEHLERPAHWPAG